MKELEDPDDDTLSSAILDISSNLMLYVILVKDISNKLMYTANNRWAEQKMVSDLKTSIDRLETGEPGSKQQLDLLKKMFAEYLL